MNAGDSISRYRILGPLGRGGMGVVYRAEDTRLQRQVALKFLDAESITDRKKQRFLNEARAAAAAHHPNICPIYDIDEDADRIFIAMAFLEGQTVQRKIASGPLTFAETVAIASQVAAGLDCAHSMGIVHRDIKSSNIMVDSGGHASIMDFGLALQPDETRLTVEGSTVGTPGYMSPEQIRGKSIDSRTDIWSLGILMFEMLTGGVAFERDHSVATIHAILSDPLPPLASLRYETPPALAAIVEKALEKRPEDRWQTAQEMAAALKRLEGGIDSTATRTMVMQAVPASPRRARWALAVILGALLLAGAAYSYRRFAGPPPAPSTSASSAATRHIAVLPFQLEVGAEKTRTISDGLVDAMTTALSDLPEAAGILTVSAADIRRRNISTPGEARRLDHVDFVIAGSAKPLAGAPGKVDVNIALVDAADGHRVDSRNFTFDAADPIASRNEAVAIEMKLLNVDLSPVTRTTLRAGDTSAPAAYSSYLQGRGLLGRYDVPGNVDKALASFEGAVKQDPDYALAWAGLAEASLRKAHDTGESKWSESALADARRAVHLNDSLAIAHSVLGQVYANAGREEEAIGEFKRAIAITPGNAEAPRELARVYNNLGRFAEAEASYKQATKARPTDWYAHLLLGLFYYGRERFGEAETELKQAAAFTPDNDLVYLDLGTVLTMQGRYEEAISEFQHSLHIRARASTYAALGTAYYYQHKFQDAADAAEAAIEQDSNNYNFWGNVGIYYKWTTAGKQKSVPSLQRAVELVTRVLEAAPKKYGARADLAEYRARLGEKAVALEEVQKIPEAARKPLASRLALVYELVGNRAEAIRLVVANFSTAASLNQIRDDPDLSGLWNAPEIRRLRDTR